MDYAFPVYKPVGPSSLKIVENIKKITGIKKVGHGGTLDPLASGVLVIGLTRKGTKKLQDISQQEKEYMGTIKLGEKSTTDDSEGEKTKIEVKHQPREEKIKQILKQFEGEIKQAPPRFSAVKVKGKRAYQLARKGKEVNLEPRQVEIKQINLIEYDYPLLKIKIVCGKGVYIRSLARDIGDKLETGGYLYELERTRVGNFRLEEALTLDDLKQRDLSQLIPVSKE